MNKTTTAQRLLPYLIAIVTFLAACLISFAPMVEGRELNMHDMTQYRGMSADITQHQKQYHEDPQWAGGLFSGMPAYLINVQYPSMVVAQVLSAVDNVASPASLIFMAMVCFFCMCLLCGFDPRPSIVPSLAYGLSTYLFLIIGAGHMTKMVAIAYAPLMLGGMFYTFRTNKWVGAAMTALFAAIEIAANHPQITYYFLLVMVAFWTGELVQAVRGKWLPRFAGITGLLVVAAVLAVGANFISLYNIQKHSKYTIRGGSELTAAPDANDKGLGLQYATAWSYGVGESLNMFIPNLMGGSSMGGFKEDGPVDQALGKYGRKDLTAHLPAYWGDQPMTGGPTYVGAVV
ncbi:MAG: hypothetical protein LBU95_00850, partial [Rikenellaceae bacterium]|nr:hypothetical protein [Rikenellaceae bacterium]